MRTHNGDYTNNDSGDVLVEFFSKAGSLMEKRKSHYGIKNETSALELFRPCWKYDSYKAMQLAAWLRDCRGGSGNRSGFRSIISWLAKETDGQKWINVNLHLVPELGRWDDLAVLVDTPCETNAIEFWSEAIVAGNGLASKWAPREKNNKVLFHKLRKFAHMSPKEFRKLLVKNTKVVETQMCSDRWFEINYNHVPSVASARYHKAFVKHDPTRYNQWKMDLASGKDEKGNDVKINADVLFPHDVVRTLKSDLGNNYTTSSSCYYRGKIKYEDSLIANAQFAALPNFFEGTDQRIMAICDFSGSMESEVCGSSTAMDVSMGLGLYCSDRVGKGNPFYRKFMPFSDDSRLVNWSNDTFSVAAQKCNNGYCGSTNITAALDRILEAATMFKATNDQIPTMLLIISDMQFNEGANGEETAVESAMKKWEAAGYKRPSIIYWNTAGYSGSPATVKDKNVGLVSGFSPSILKSILAGKDFTPMAIMEETLKKYDIVKPTDA